MLNESGLPTPLKSTTQNASPPEAGLQPDRGTAFAAARPVFADKPSVASPQTLAAATPSNPMQQSMLQSANPSPVFQQMLLMFHFGATSKKIGNPFVERMELAGSSSAAPRKQSLKGLVEAQPASALESDADWEEAPLSGKNLNLQF